MQRIPLLIIDEVGETVDHRVGDDVAEDLAPIEKDLSLVTKGDS